MPRLISAVSLCAKDRVALHRDPSPQEAEIHHPQHGCHADQLSPVAAQSDDVHGEGDAAVQTPLSQVLPVAQALPQVPQLLGSVSSLTQSRPPSAEQLEVPPVQTKELPDSHTTAAETVVNATPAHTFVDASWPSGTTSSATVAVTVVCPVQLPQLKFTVVSVVSLPPSAGLRKPPRVPVPLQPVSDQFRAEPVEPRRMTVTVAVASCGPSNSAGEIENDAMPGHEYAGGDAPSPQHISSEYAHPSGTPSPPPHVVGPSTYRQLIPPASAQAGSTSPGPPQSFVQVPARQHGEPVLKQHAGSSSLIVSPARAKLAMNCPIAARLIVAWSHKAAVHGNSGQLP
jgi:hypothetical protein